jgi:hypothetical protein
MKRKRKRIGHRDRPGQTGSSSGRSLTAVASRADLSGRQVAVLGKSRKVLGNPRNPSTETSPGVESGFPGVFDVLSKPKNAGRAMMCEQAIASRLLDAWKGAGRPSRSCIDPYCIDPDSKKRSGDSRYGRRLPSCIESRPNVDLMADPRITHPRFRELSAVDLGEAAGW